MADPAERTLGAMITSSLKKNYDRIEMAEGVRRLVAFGWDHAKIAKRMGLSRRKVEVIARAARAFSASRR